MHRSDREWVDSLFVYRARGIYVVEYIFFHSLQSTKITLTFITITTRSVRGTRLFPLCIRDLFKTLSAMLYKNIIFKNSGS